MRILFVCNDLDYFLLHRSNLLGPLLKRGHEVILCAGGNRASAKRLPERVRFIHVALNQHRLDPWSDAKLTAHYASIVAKTSPDVVHCFTIKPNLYMALALTLRRLIDRRRPRFVQTFPGLGKVFEPTSAFTTNIRRYVVTALFRTSRRLLDQWATFENPADREAMVNAGVAVRSRTRVIAGAGLNLDHYRPPARPRDGKLTFLFASRLLRSKGIDTFLDTAASVHSQGARASFLVAGSSDPGNPDAVDMELIEAAERRGEVRYIGTLSSDEMVAALQSSDVVCLPTRLREGFPRILVEAAACGCALIASDQPAIRQVLTSPQNGWLIDPNRGPSLTDAVKQCLTDPGRVRAMGAGNAVTVRTMPVDDASVFQAFFATYGHQRQHK